MISPGIRSQTIKLRPDGNYEATLRAKLFRIAQYSLKSSACRLLPKRRITSFPHTNHSVGLIKERTSMRSRKDLEHRRAGLIRKSG